MFAIRNLLAFAVISCSALQPLQAQSRTQNGATVGGLAGAVIGGIIGKQNDETPEGVLIGGAVGAITGGLIGKAQDNEPSSTRGTPPAKRSTNGPPSSSCRSRARWRSHTVTGEVRPAAHVANSFETQAPVSDRAA